MQKDIYRIIDANFNRAREAARVIEEFCRFVLDDGRLSSQAKALRHRLCALVGKLDYARLVASRDTVGDVGVGLEIKEQLGRKEAYDCFVAAARRFGEAVRVLAEMTQIVEPAISGQIEQLRYDLYTLEKDVAAAADRNKRFKKVSLYVLISSNDRDEVLKLAEECIAGGADCLQLRAKDIEDAKLLTLAGDFTGMCRSGNVISIINDRADIALLSGADGVHLGQGDLPLSAVEKLWSRSLISGVSTHNAEELDAACLSRPTYAAAGAVFASPTKPQVAAAGLEYLRGAVTRLKESGIYSVAIGGITVDNVESVANTGVDAIAVGSAITNQPRQNCQSLKEKILRAKKAAV